MSISWGFSKMKVLIVTDKYWPEVGAAPSRLANMAEGLCACGCEVDVLTSLPNYPKGRIFEGYRDCLFRQEKQNGITIFRYWVKATVSKKPLARIANMFSFACVMWLFSFRRKLIKSYDRIIIQTPSLVAATSAMIMMKKLYGRTCVLNVSDLWPLSAVDIGAIRHGSLSYRFMAMLERFLYRHADAILGQSNEIISYIKSVGFNSQKFFLYRNLQPYEVNYGVKKRHQPLRIVYAGLLGVAQDILGIVKHVDFASMGAELHLYGGGNQAEAIEDYIAAGAKGIFYHGFQEKEHMGTELMKYDASIVPLASCITGAVPSKIFDLIPIGLPILFCGGGEGAQIVSFYQLGYVSEPSDYEFLKKNVRHLAALDEAAYMQLVENCIVAAHTDFDFSTQMKSAFHFLQSL